MKFTTFNGEATLEQLAQRLFGDVAKSQPALVQDLVAQNPHLENLSTLPPGTILVLGDKAPLVKQEERTTGTVERVLAALDDLEARRNTAADQQLAEIRATVELAKVPGVREAFRALPELAKQFEEAVRAASERESAVDAERNETTEALKRARATLRPTPGRRRPVGVP